MIKEILNRAIPFKVSLSTSFRSVNHRIGFLIEGEYGYGEWAPFSDYQPKAAAKWLAAALEASDQPRQPVKRLQVPVNGIVPALDPGASADWAENLVQTYGVSTLKIKVGDSNQLSRVRAISERLPNITLRVDANGCYSLDQARDLIPKYAELGVSVIEQPCANLSDCKSVKGQGLLIAIDESIRLASEISDEFIEQLHLATDLIVLKPIPLGGSAQTLSLAEKLSLPVIVSGSLDTSVGLSYVSYVAALLPNEVLPSGLGTSVLLADDLVENSLLPDKGMLSVGAITPDKIKLSQAKDRVNEHERAELTERLTGASVELMKLSEVIK